MIYWWQNLQYTIDPVIFRLGFIDVKYYNLLIIFGAGLNYFLIRWRASRESELITPKIIDDYFLYFLLGLLIGARTGYFVFYQTNTLLHAPLRVFFPGNGEIFNPFAGLSYHGALIGILLATSIFCFKRKINLFSLADTVVPVIPLGYTCGRLGNFFNGELYGRVTSLPVGMYFRGDHGGNLHHPSQLYEAALEGVLLFLILWNIRRFPVLKNRFLGLYLMGYGSMRFIAEFFRKPDAHIGYLWQGLTEGQILCAVMILIGALLISPAVHSFYPEEMYEGI